VKVLKLKDMKKGWFIGNFEPTVFKTKDFEVSYRTHPKNSNWEVHTHKVTTEINLLIKGKMTMCGKELNSGDIFIVYPNEISDPVFFEDCSIICVRVPSDPSDKYIIEK
jgi:hypothetical protein